MIVLASRTNKQKNRPKARTDARDRAHEQTKDDTRARTSRVRPVRRMSDRTVTVALFDPHMSARFPYLTYARDSEFHRQRIQREYRARDRWVPERPSLLPMTHDSRERLTYTRTIASTKPFGTYVVEPVGPCPTLVGPRNELARRELGASQRPWTNPPLIMSRSFAEPPRMFRKYLETSTTSVHKPYSPVLSWRP